MASASVKSHYGMRGKYASHEDEISDVIGGTRFTHSDREYQDDGAGAAQPSGEEEECIRQYTFDEIHSLVLEEDGNYGFNPKFDAFVTFLVKECATRRGSSVPSSRSANWRANGTQVRRTDSLSSQRSAGSSAGSGASGRETTASGGRGGRPGGAVSHRIDSFGEMSAGSRATANIVSGMGDRVASEVSLGAASWRTGGSHATAESGSGTPTPACTPTVILDKAAMSETDKAYHMINGLLNKFSGDNYRTIRTQIIEALDRLRDDVVLIERVTDNVFEMASTQAVWCKHYAELVRDLGERYEQMMPIILKKYNDYLGVFTRIEADVNPEDDYDRFCEQNKDRNRRKGYAQFAGELFNLNLLPTEALYSMLRSMVKTVQDHINASSHVQQIEELVGCVQSIVTAIGRRNFRDAAFCEIITQLGRIRATPRAETRGVSKKCSFMIDDIREAHDNEWRPFKNARK